MWQAKWWLMTCWLRVSNIKFGNNIVVTMRLIINCWKLSQVLQRSQASCLVVSQLSSHQNYSLVLLSFCCFVLYHLAISTQSSCTEDVVRMLILLCTSMSFSMWMSILFHRRSNITDNLTQLRYGSKWILYQNHDSHVLPLSNFIPCNGTTVI